jgi:hypothetical protein
VNQLGDVRSHPSIENSCRMTQLFEWNIELPKIQFDVVNRNLVATESYLPIFLCTEATQRFIDNLPSTSSNRAIGRGR